MRCDGGRDPAQHVTVWVTMCPTHASLLLKGNDLLRLLDVQVRASADLYEDQVGRHRHGDDKFQMATTDLDDLCNALVGLLSPNLGIIEARNLPKLLHPGHDLVDGTVNQAEVIGLLGLQG